MKRTRLRPKSKKRAKADRELAPHLDAYRAEFPICQVCGKAKGTDIHEVVRGAGRMKARAQRSLVIHVCRPCHDKIQPEQFLWQLARKFHATPELFDLELALEVKGWSEGALTMSEIEVVAAGFGWERFNTKGRMG